MSVLLRTCSAKCFFFILFCGAVSTTNHSQCNLNTCFDISKCLPSSSGDVLHYVYPRSKDLIQSPSYATILDLLQESPFYTSDPEKACIFFLPIDTLNRDVLSSNRFVEGVDILLNRGNSKLIDDIHSEIEYISYLNELKVDHQNATELYLATSGKQSLHEVVLKHWQLSRLLLKYWNGGENHVIFNLYSGTYPHYDENDLQFDFGKAILAKASMSIAKYRDGFDISLPLFHENVPLDSKYSPSHIKRSHSNESKKYFISFKGKRYVYGSGSYIRNSMHHLHNGQDQIFITTCKHGSEWEKFQDARCSSDNEMYDEWSFDDLLWNSTFCLVARGRRLGSYRFLEVLQTSVDESVTPCVGVVLRDDWVLPFSSLIDWSEVIVLADDSKPFTMVDALHDIPEERLNVMRKNSKFVLFNYVGGVKQIVNTVLKILNDRIRKLLV